MKGLTYFLVFFLLTIIKPGYAQTPVDTTKFQYNSVTIDAPLLVGFWESADSLKTTIEFLDMNFEVALKLQASYSYSFLQDSLKKVSVSGFMANWPPYDCTLNMISPRILEIVYSQMGVITGRTKYIKIKE